MILDKILLPLAEKRNAGNEEYLERHKRIINTLPYREVLGLYIPEMIKVAKELSREKTNAKTILSRFLATNSHKLFFEEMLIWGFLINDIDMSLPERVIQLQSYIPTMDNWAVCDSFCAHAKWMSHIKKKELWEILKPWVQSEKEFEVRFAIVASMTFMLDKEWLNDLFSELEKINCQRIHSAYITSDKKTQRTQLGYVLGKSPYYVRMGIAWFLATALAKFPEETRSFVRKTSISDDIIQLYFRKARESRRTRTTPYI